FTREDQEDLFQEIALQVWKSVGAFRQESSEVTWLYRIALNTALKWTSKEQRRSIAQDKASLLQEGTNYHNEQLSWLYDQIAHLPKVDRSLILLLLDGFSYRTIANITGLTENHVGVKIHRIKQHLAAAATPEVHE
ncbi:MAG: RNA polymerase sigma factor, partial [Bacteroidota bacterium]